MRTRSIGEARTTRILRAATAIRELRLSAVTEADHRRIVIVERAIQDLDDIQAELKSSAEHAVELLRPHRENAFVTDAITFLAPLLVPVVGGGVPVAPRSKLPVIPCATCQRPLARRGKRVSRSGLCRSCLRDRTRRARRSCVVAGCAAVESKSGAAAARRAGNVGAWCCAKHRPRRPDLLACNCGARRACPRGYTRSQISHWRCRSCAMRCNRNAARPVASVTSPPTGMEAETPRGAERMHAAPSKSKR